MSADLYSSDEHCMEFSNEEILEFLVKPLREYPQFDILLRTEEDEELEDNTDEKIVNVTLDGKLDNFAVDFWDSYASIWVCGEGFNFFDDKVREILSGSEFQRWIIHEGKFRDKTHKEILELIKEFVLVLSGTQKMDVKETIVPETGWPHQARERYDYVIKLENPTSEAREVTFENIKFIINGE